MALPGPFLSGQKLTAGQLNDATQKTIASVDVNIDGQIAGPIGATETTVTQFTLGPFDQVAGALYKVHMRTIVQQTNAGEEFFMIMRKNTALTGTIIASWDMWKPPAANSGFLFTGWADFGAVADEAGVTYYFSVVRFSGAGTIIVYGHHPSATPLSVTSSGVKIERTGYASEFVVVT